MDRCFVQERDFSLLTFHFSLIMSNFAPFYT